MERQEFSLEQIQRARDELLKRVVEFFSIQQGVVGVLLSGSIPNGSDDAYSDIDLRVFTTPESHANFVEKRCEIPHEWGELLFNEWMDGTEVCVSHFRPFIKIDVFYWNIDKVEPSAWFKLPSAILFDHDHTLKSFLARCADIEFDKPASQEVSRITSKAIACAHESLRKSRRGELYYAQSFLERVRFYIVQMEDWINKLEPHNLTDLKIEKRISCRLQTVLQESYPPLDAMKIEATLRIVCALMSAQIIDLHAAFTLDRVLKNDLAAVELILNQQIKESSQ